MKLNFVVLLLIASFALPTTALAGENAAVEKMKGAATPTDVQSQQKALKEVAPEFEKLLKSKGLSPQDMKCHTVCSAEVVIGPDGKPQTIMRCSLICE